MCTKHDLTEKLKDKVVEKFLVESDCGGEFIHILFTDGTKVNIQNTSEGGVPIIVSIWGSGSHSDYT